jgi:chromate reductase, NAD(P)H dehydrogenase (quinone)
MTRSHGPLTFLGIAGSLRRGSYNRSLIRAAIELAPAGTTVIPYDLMDLPMYNGDVEAEGDPEAVAAFKHAINAADSLLIATPEYNHCVPGVLKNAIDWASRPARSSVLTGKPVAIMGATPGSGGTARAQAHLRDGLGQRPTGCRAGRPDDCLPRTIHGSCRASGLAIPVRVSP